MRRVSFILGALVVVAALVVARPVMTRWEADRTANRLVQVLYRRDSTAFASLSLRGTATTFRCVQALWPAEFWSLHGGVPRLRRIPAPPEELGYRMTGDILPGKAAPAIFDFFILKAHPTKVDHIFVDSHLGVWTPEVYACLQPSVAQQARAAWGV